jgi:hypothetical protein
VVLEQRNDRVACGFFSLQAFVRSEFSLGHVRRIPL